MGATMELNISDEKYAELMEAAEWRLNTSLHDICDRALSEYLCQYFEETIPCLQMDPEKEARLEKESKQELYAMGYEGLLNRKIRKESKRDGNVVRLAKPGIRLTHNDMQ